MQARSGQLQTTIDLETASDTDKLELRLWLRLLTCGNLIESKVRAKLRDEFSMTLPQFDLMAQLDRGPSTGLTMGALGNRMMVSAGNITGITDRLERSGYVVRVRSGTDRRSQNVQLTEAGRQQFNNVAYAHHSWIVAMFDELDGASQKVLFDKLGALKQSVQTHYVEE